METPATPPTPDPTPVQGAAEAVSRRAPRRSGNGKVAVAARGLHIERRFTKPGVHPYDEVQWERRTASIANEKGEVVFEQKDCEIPAFWSQMATNVVVSKYFRGPLGTPRRETSVRQVISRVVDTITGWGREGGYFAAEGDAEAFSDELTHLILHQRMSFNSPVWFNLGVPGARQQASACFIQSVDDSMESILTLAKNEGMLFKGGSGTGTNLSSIRSSYEQLAGGGTASGPVSFMKGFDAFAGVIKSGGTTRRAAKMVILNADHPDVEEFITCKVSEERKAWALIDAGYDPSFTGEAYASVFFQNSNNSVRVTDEFMRAVEEDRDWQLRAVTDPSRILKTVKARALLRLIAESAWQCGDPGIQYDTTINDWHTSSNSGRINASNPCCLVGSTLVETSLGQISFEELYRAGERGERLPLARTWNLTGRRNEARPIRRVWVAGETNQVVELTLADGALRVQSTPEHRFLTADGSWVQAINLTPGQAMLLDDEAIKELALLRLTMDGKVGTAPLLASRAGMPVRDGRPTVTVTSVQLVSLEAPVRVYDMEVAGTHNFVVGAPVPGVSLVAHNSEFMYLDDTSCNLASINLLRYLKDDGSFAIDDYRHAIRLTITAQEIIVSNASYPTEKITKNSEDFRPLGLGYANLGALLMARGLAYDSPRGRDLAACLTAILTGEGYAQSALIAREVGPFEGFAVNRQPMLRVMAKHREAAYAIPSATVDTDLLAAARACWDEAHELGARHGYRNSQISVIAPTGCLTPDSLVLTSRGLVRLRTLGNPHGAKWQDLDIEVATHQGPRKTSKFFVNGVEPVVTATTRRGYRIRGTTGHRIKVLDADGEWQWRRLSDLQGRDRLPVMLGGLVGEPVPVALPPLPDAYWTADHDTRVPRYVTPELTELVGYFMGDGSLHAKGLRFCVSPQDQDLAEHLAGLGRELFGLRPDVSRKPSYIEVTFTSVRLVMWWEACGFAKLSPSSGHTGKGWLAHIPDAILHTNNPAVYAAFVRGLFEADGTVSSGYPSFTTVTELLARDMQSLLLSLGFVTTLDLQSPSKGGWSGRPKYRVRLLNVRMAEQFATTVGFVSARKQTLCRGIEHQQSERYDHIPISRDLIDRLAPENDRLRRVLLMEHNRGTVTRRVATELLTRTADAELAQALRFFYDEVAEVVLGGEDLTLDLSVPDNVTYVANGFVSHNTISFMLDCDTTGVEPDIALVKYKKLVGGGMLKMVNNTVPAALKRLGYGEGEIADIVGHIDANDTIEGAPKLRDDDLPVFDCAFTPHNGKRSIAWQGHVRMMAAVQPFVSGAISKTVNMPSDSTVQDVEKAYIDGWKMGLKALAIYRDGSKRSQPLATSMDKTTGEKVRIVERPLRRKLPAERQALTHRFEIGGHEGYITVGLYEDGSPGEIFVKMAKEGSTVSGLTDSFAIAVSFALQYGVPLDFLVNKFAHMRFEPQGFTRNAEIPIAKSIVDYIFRWLGSRFLSPEKQAEIGIIRRDEEDGSEEPLPAVEGPANAAQVVMPLGFTEISPTATFQNQADAPSCSECGSLMVRSGSCYKCHNCGATSGCS